MLRGRRNRRRGVTYISIFVGTANIKLFVVLLFTVLIFMTSFPKATVTHQHLLVRSEVVRSS